MYHGYYYGFDTTYLLLVVPALLIALIAQIQVKSAFSRYARVRCTSGLTGAQAAQRRPFRLQRRRSDPVLGAGCDAVGECARPYGRPRQQPPRAERRCDPRRDGRHPQRIYRKVTRKSRTPRTVVRGVRALWEEGNGGTGKKEGYSPGCAAVRRRPVPAAAAPLA